MQTAATTTGAARSALPTQDLRPRALGKSSLPAAGPARAHIRPAPARRGALHVANAAKVTFPKRPVAAPVEAPALAKLNPTAPLRTPLIAGNWKLNPATLEAAEALANLVAAADRTMRDHKPEHEVEVAVIPPAPFLAPVAAALAGTTVAVGAQDIVPDAAGAFTGGVAASMVASMGAEYVLTGHSERRTLWGEDDALVNAKTRAALDAGLKPILCIGETKEQYVAGENKKVCREQLAAGLDGVSAEEMGDVVVAYEPVWAIGTGLTATPAVAQSVHKFIRSWFRDAYGEEVAQRMRIMYGGSASPETVDELMACPDIDGCLVGGASLSGEKFGCLMNHSTAGGADRIWAEEVVPCANTLGESPVWCAARERLYWVSAPDQELWSWDLHSAPEKYDLPAVVGCCALQKGGAMLVALELGICTFDPESGALTHLCDFEPENEATRPNDGRADRFGNFVVGSYNKMHRQDGAEIGGAYRLSPNGELTEIMDYRFRVSNGTCFSPDGGVMYFCDTPTRRVFAFDYSPAAPTITNRRLVYEQPSALPGGPDGATVDADGFLWIALSGAAQVVRIDPESGEVVATIEVPVSSPTSCTIGGPNLDTMFVTTRGPDGGALFAAKLPAGVRGLPEPEFGLDAAKVREQAVQMSVFKF